VIFDERFFKEEIQDHVDHPHFLQRALWIKEYVPEGALVCILGCGFGHLVKHLNELGVQAFGVDVSIYAFNCRVHEQVFCGSADSFEIPKGTYIFSWNMLDCLSEEMANTVALNLKDVEHQIHILCCVGNYEGYYIQSKSYWEELFPKAIIINYEHPESDLKIPLSWGRVSN